MRAQVPLTSLVTTPGLIPRASLLLGAMWLQRELLHLMQPQFRQCDLHDGVVGSEAEPEDSMEQSNQTVRRQMIDGFVAIGTKETKFMPEWRPVVISSSEREIAMERTL